MNKTLKIPFEMDYIKYSVAKIDAEMGGVFTDDNTKTIERKLKAIEKELKITWIKGYKKGLIDKTNY